MNKIILYKWKSPRCGIFCSDRWFSIYEQSILQWGPAENHRRAVKSSRHWTAETNSYTWRKPVWNQDSASASRFVDLLPLKFLSHIHIFCLSVYTCHLVSDIVQKDVAVGPPPQEFKSETWYGMKRTNFPSKVANGALHCESIRSIIMLRCMYV